MVSFEGVKDWFRVGASAAAIALASYFPSTAGAAGPSRTPAPQPQRIQQDQLDAYLTQFGTSKANLQRQRINFSSAAYDDKDRDNSFSTGDQIILYNAQGNPGWTIIHGDPSVKVVQPARPATSGRPAASANRGGSAQRPAGQRQPPARAPASSPQAAGSPAPGNVVRWTLPQNLDEISRLFSSQQNIPTNVIGNVKSVNVINNGPRELDPSDVIQVYDSNNRLIWQGNYAVPTAQPAAPTGTPTPQPGYGWLGGVPIIFSGRANVGYNRETVSGTLLDGMGTKWKDVYSGLVLRLRDVGLTTDETRKQLHGRFLVDGNYLLAGKISGTASGSFSRLETLARILSGVSGTADGLRWSVDAGLATELDSSSYKFTGGTFTTSRSGVGGELAAKLSSKTMSVGARDVYVSLNSTQHSIDPTQDLRYKSRDTKNLFAVIFEIPKLGPVALYSEVGMESTSSDARSGQGDWTQHVPYGRVEVTKAAGSVHLGGFAQIATVARSPIPAAEVGSTTFQIGAALNYQFSMPKK